ncbi:DNA topoisomerase IB [Tianweitania sediminis]|uniref:DNA topoisomerase n=1 Tax=Tianweitania sediminis TaxID=1502156 RepID=A0A8J7R597_9HYPH|nr:DNA topoisomerase IB [Tianweitania sediminis]
MGGETVAEKVEAIADVPKIPGLVYQTDEGPGIRRVKSGTGFGYRDPDGNKITDPETRDRIRALAIPPAWTHVWISPDPAGHIQATGRDVRGRKQYRYHPKWSEHRDELKYSNLSNFAEALPSLRKQVEADLARRGLPYERVVASLVWLLENTLIRVGNPAYARDNKSFGLTTLRDRHVKIDGTKMRFSFKGKSGKEWNLRLVDRRMAKLIRSTQDLPGQSLFQYIGEDGLRHAIRSDDVNSYIRSHAGSDFSSRNFRTWGGTLSAASIFAATPLPETQRATRITLNETIDKVAGRLGNTRAVCRRSYIHPRVVESWSAGTLTDELRAARRRFRKPVEGLDEEETLLKVWLAASATS